MNKGELVDQLAAKTGKSKKDSEQFVNALQDIIGEALSSGDKITLVGFGTFEVRERKERAGRNPSNGQPITIPASKSAVFVPGKLLKEKVRV